MNIRVDGPAVVSRQGRDQYRVIAESDALGGRLFIVEFVIKAGSEPPLRRHRHEDLLLFVLDGRLTFHVDGQQHPASPGSSLIVPKGCAHGFVVDSETARLLMVLSPAGAEELIAQLFESPHVYGGSSGVDSCGMIDHLVTTAARYDVEITGPPPGAA
jgi:quercetin dioxygenase-like cupin family protein